MFTIVVPASPPSWPPMSLAWISTWYSSFTSLSILGKAVFITPGAQQDGWEIQIMEERKRGGRGRQWWGDKQTKGKSGKHKVPRNTFRAEYTWKCTTHLDPSRSCRSGSDQNWNGGHRTNWKHLTFSPEHEWALIMIHLKIRDPEIREGFCCTFVAWWVVG